MKNRINNCYRILSLMFIFSLFAMPVWAEGEVATKELVVPGSWVPPGDWFIFLVILIVMFGSLIAIAFIRSSLNTNTWSLSDALSEEIEVALMGEDGKPIIDESSKKPIMVTKLSASSSRMVVLMGMIVIMFMFLGFGAFALFAFAKTGNMPSSIDQVVNFLLAGLTLFAPYVVNKFSSMFESLTPKKQ